MTDIKTVAGKATGLHSWDGKRRMLGYQQIVLAEDGHEVGPIDGRVGPQTLNALESWERAQRGDPPDLWRDAVQLPDDDSHDEMVDIYGEPGDYSQQRRFTLPYTMRLAWDLGVTVTQVTMHRLAGDEAMAALRQVHKEYNVYEIAKYGFDLFGGTYNPRRIRGGSRWSTHAWGIAIDIDPARNQLRWKRDMAHLARPECRDFLKAWTDIGWHSLGQEMDFDWMHFQRARP